MKTILVDAVNTTIIRDSEGNYSRFKELFYLFETYKNPKLILTNADDDQIIKSGLDSVPYPIFTMKHNPDKIDPIYFKTLLERYNFDNNEVIYFDHNPEAVKSAESLGIISHHYNKEKRDLISLKKFLDENL